ncbi:MAG: hypothetical protein KGZ96_01035 [Clostridia bacterium]|jgi:hypothetical protein|nr:hypothetical protein [Clostridia bacterium]
MANILHLRRKKGVIVLISLTLVLVLGLGSALAGEPELEKVLVMSTVESAESRGYKFDDGKALESLDKQAEVKVTLEQAIQVAKKHFAVNQGFDVFRSSYNEYDGNKNWQLYWHDKTGSLGEMSVAINADTGEVMSYHYYDPREHENIAAQGYLPKLTREEAEQIALGYFEKLTDKKASQISLLPRFYEEPMLRKGTKYYDFSYAGLANGVIYTLNKVAITINADTGELRSFYHTWDSQAVFPNKNNITQGEAEKLVKEELDIELAYFKGFDRSGERPVQLVYQVKNANQVMIDAATGKPIVRQDYYYFDGFYGGDMESAKRMMPEYALSPAEQQELEKMADLMDQGKAKAKGKLTACICVGLS